MSPDGIEAGRVLRYERADWTLPAGCFYALLAEYGERIASDRDSADCYSASQSRPSKLAKVMLLQYRAELSDRDAMEAADLRWKAALDLPVDHQGWDPSSLTRFRARLPRSPPVG